MSGRCGSIVVCYLEVQGSYKLAIPVVLNHLEAPIVELARL